VLSVATTNELAELLGDDLDTTGALESGVVKRTKLSGRWLYTTNASFEDALDAALESTVSYLEEWLLGRSPYLVGGVCKLPTSSGIGKGAMDLLIKELASQGRLGGLALSSASYQPFIAFHRLLDADEVAVQIKALSRLLAETGRARPSDLPDPERRVPRKAWRDVLLRHGEWRGWGWIENGELVAWR
jgi:hypothetical protein